MPSFCAVLNCSDKYGHAENISFHKFPFKRQELLQKWLDFAQRGADWQPSRWSAICSRHFREEDFNCASERKTLKKTAVPSIRLAEHNTSHSAPLVPSIERKTAAAAQKAPTTHTVALQNVEEYSEEEEQQQLQSLTLQSYNSPNTPKVKCRLCGHASSAVVTFSTNFEIYGMIQKCLPTLNIQNDDNLPKEMCRVCLKRLENFSRFIDRVLETQSELQRKFRNEKSSNSANKLAERQLKIKQEPVVRVKQELAEGLESFLSDELDMGIDESCEQEHETAAVEQKYDFCDFPILNTQDIINNCDIMEIINLDDPFINIPDDDANTNCDNIEPLQPPSKRPLPSAHELLQAHLLIEEHNYAYAAEDLKEEWQIKNTYKTEKTEGDEQEDVDQAPAENEDEFPNFAGEEANTVDHTALTTETSTLATSTLTTTTIQSADSRSAKPIVTSVSALAQSGMPLPMPHTVDAGNSMIAAVKDSAIPLKPHNKPNIVVLNESIVKSSSAFQLHACVCCHMKFFSVESLSQHYATLHTQLPMVSVPSMNIWENNAHMQSEMESCKVEKECERNVQTQNNSTTMVGDSVRNVEHPNETSGQSIANGDAETEIQHARSVRNQINILEMQQTFVRQFEHHSAIHNCNSNYSLNRSNTNGPALSVVRKQLSLAEHKESAAELHLATTTAAMNQRCTIGAKSNTPAVMPKLKQAENSQQLQKIKNFKSRKKHVPLSEKITANYLQLRRRYRQLQRHCRKLQACADMHIKSTEHNGFANERQSTQKQHALSPCCRVCKQQFTSIYQLLQHQRQRMHHVRKPHTRFASTCCGCEKFFRSKVALRNHMRYICQSLPLRWLKLQMQTFKCRCCRRSTFNHWRLYRRHELRCQRSRKKRMQRKIGQKKRKTQRQVKVKDKTLALDKWQKQQEVTHAAQAANTQLCKLNGNVGKTHTPARQYVCPVCEKVFANANCLNQHSITHTTQRTHKCGLCERVFKRRNGLTQHMKGFHLQLKPYECLVCRHRYALKCDMLRCRHSLGRIAGTLDSGQLAAVK